MVIDRSLNGRGLDSTQSQVFGSERSVSCHCLPKYRERDTRKRRTFVTDCSSRKGLLQCCIISTYISGDDHSAMEILMVLVNLRRTSYFVKLY